MSTSDPRHYDVVDRVGYQDFFTFNNPAAALVRRYQCTRCDQAAHYFLDEKWIAPGLVENLVAQILGLRVLSDQALKQVNALFYLQWRQFDLGDIKAGNRATHL